jgi:hypothetical protein
MGRLYNLQCLSLPYIILPPGEPFLLTPYGPQAPFRVVVTYGLTGNQHIEQQ